MVIRRVDESPFLMQRKLEEGLKRIEDTLSKSTLHSTRKLRNLTREIDDNLERAAALESVSGVSSSAKKALQSAHRECSSQFVDRWVEDIVEEVQELTYKAPSLTASSAVSKVKALRSSIFEIRREFSLSTENLGFIKAAERLLSMLEKGESLVEYGQVTGAKAAVEATKPVANHDLAMQLCEISHLFVMNRTFEARSVFETKLSPSEQAEVLSITTTLGFSLPSLESCNEDHFYDAHMAFARACLSLSDRCATGELFSHNEDGLPSMEETLSFFEDFPTEDIP